MRRNNHTHGSRHSTHSPVAKGIIPPAARMRDVVASDIMTADPIVIDEDTSLGDALDILVNMEIRHLPVMREGEVVGMLSDRDILSSERSEQRLDRSVRSVMNSDVISVEPDSDIGEISALLMEHRIGALPVIDPQRGDLLGIVSYIDVLRELSRSAD